MGTAGSRHEDRRRVKPGDESIAGRLLDLAETHDGEWWNRQSLVEAYLAVWPEEKPASVARVLQRLLSNGAFEVHETGIRRRGRSHLENLPTGAAALDAAIAELEAAIATEEAAVTGEAAAGEEGEANDESRPEERLPST